jgi:nucleoside triphosphatase
MKSKIINGFPRGIEVVTSAIIENKKGEIFLARSPKWNNKWTLPGGHVEPGEKIMSAVVREGREETGLVLRPVDVIIWGEMISPKEFSRPTHLIFFDIYCRIIRGKVKLENRELTECVWARPKDALKLELAEGYGKVIRKFILYKQKGMQ